VVLFQNVCFLENGPFEKGPFWIRTILGTPKADLLEAVMGLRELFPTTRWVAWGDMVDNICTDVYDGWNSPELADVWDQRVVKDTLFARFGLNDLCAWLNQVAKSQMRMAAHAALQRPLCEDLVTVICRFLCDN
jgi:hypothetical protein